MSLGGLTLNGSHGNFESNSSALFMPWGKKIEIISPFVSEELESLSFTTLSGSILSYICTFISLRK